jgi:hypothetical protein
MIQFEEIMNADISSSTRLLFEEKVHLTGITEYGIKWKDLTEGRIPPVPEGVRFDIAFEGSLYGPRIEGTIKGTDYLNVRADGRFMRNIHASITTNTGHRIALHEDGILVPALDGKGFLQLNMQFTSHVPEYFWMNKIQCWGTGICDMHRGEVYVKTYEGNFEITNKSVLYHKN